MTNMATISLLYRTPEPGSNSYGCLIDRSLGIKGALRWGNDKEIDSALENICANQSPEKTATIIMVLRQQGQFDNGFNFKG